MAKNRVQWHDFLNNVNELSVYTAVFITTISYCSS